MDLSTTPRSVGFKLFSICALIIISASGLVLKITPYNIATSPDSIAYLDAAQHINAGDGLVSTNYVYGAEQKLVPFTVWPPLYPAVLSLSPSIENAPLFAAVQVAMIILSLNGVLMFFILRKIIGDLLSLMAVAVFMISSANVIVTNYAWSEPLTILMLLFSIHFSMNCHKAAKENNKTRLYLNLFFLATVLAGLFYTRYIGLIFGFILPLTWLFSFNRAKYLPTYILSLLWFLFLTGGLLLRNYLLGDITGGDVHDSARRASTLSLLDNFGAVVDSLYLLIPGNVSLILTIVLICIVLVVVIKKIVSKFSLVINPVASSDQIKFFVWLMIAIVPIYLGALIILRSITTFEDIRIRYIAVISPCLIMLVFVTFFKYKRSIIHSWGSALFVGTNVALIVLFTVQGGIVIDNARSNWKQYGEPRMLLTGTQTKMFYSHLTSPSIIAGVRQTIKTIGAEKEDLIISEYPKVWAFISGMKFRRLKGGINQQSLGQLKQIQDKGFVFLTQKNSIIAWQKFSAAKEEIVNSPVVVISLPLAQ